MGCLEYVYIIYKSSHDLNSDTFTFKLNHFHNEIPKIPKNYPTPKILRQTT
jgi:hypothetical protein